MSVVLRVGAVRVNSYGADHLTSGQDATNSDSDVLDIPTAEEVCHRPAPTYPGCFGLPYQDHNYGAPPPLSPTPPKSPPPAPAPVKVNGVAELEEEAKVPLVSQEEEVVEDSVTRCICGFLHDDGYMICCDKCSVWQHIDCMGVDRNNIPENYCCEVCEPRKLDFERARMIQLRKREEIDTSATDTDPEEPANALASLGKKQVQAKPKAAKQRRSSKAGAREKGMLKTPKLARSGQYKRDKKLKLTKKEKENMKEASKKQKMMKNSLARQKKLKKKLSSSLVQNKAEQWNNLYGLWSNYEEAKENEYSPEILELLSRAKSNGIHSPHSIGVFPEELLVRLYQVAEVKKNRKGLEATDLIAPGRAVIEFKGKVMLRDHFQHNAVINQTRPYMLFYSKFEGLDLCIDASAYGGDARFIRRSCTPNSEMCHIIDNGNLHFIVQAKKEIAKGSEITIPFDYNYQDCATPVECACGRVACPVAKFWKKMKLARKQADKQKRKRNASGEGRVRRNSQSKGSPVKAAAGSKSPVRGSPVKNNVTIPLPPSLCEPVVPAETASAETAQAPKSATSSRRSSRASEIKEERETKASKTAPGAGAKEHPPKAAAVQSHSSSVDSHSGDAPAAQAVSESEADSSSECPKKMTREERKMEAIMKAFEKMAKREERRKEALARMDKKHDVKKEEPGESTHPPHSTAGNSSESGSERATDTLPSATPASSTGAHDLEGKVVIKVEEPNPVTESPVKPQRKKTKRQRRRSRVQSMSALESLHSTTAPLPSAPSSQLAGLGSDSLHLTEEDSREEAPNDHFSTMPAATSTPGHPDMAHNSQDSAATYMFHKTKKHLYNEWSVSRGPDGRSGGRIDPLEVHVGEEEIVPYTPSPRNAIEHWQRRHSTSAGCSARASDSSVGSAKKRWLRQAMHETGPSGAESGSSSPVHTGSSSPIHHSSLPSPGGSPPADFVTPLKKRRLARESLSQDQAPASLPSTPSPSLAPVAPPDFITTSLGFSSTTPTATVTSATLAAADVEESSTNACGVEGFEGQQVDSKVAEDSRLGLGCSENNVAEMEAEPAGNVDPVSQSSQLEELSMDGLSSCTADKSVRHATVGSSSTATTAGSADRSDFCDSVDRDVGDVQTSSSTLLGSDALPQGTSSEATAMEVSLVDSSDAAGEGGPSSQREGSGDGVGVGSTDSEMPRLRAQSTDVNVCVGAEVEQSEERRVESSLPMPNSLPAVQEEMAEGAVSEGSNLMEESMEVEESGNEASGSACVGSQEETERSPTLKAAVQQGECQVNSSQDVHRNLRLVARTGSPSQEESENNVSSESASRAQPARNCTSSASDQERTGVSSAQDSSPVSSVVRDMDFAVTSDTEWGPSSSTQVRSNIRQTRWQAAPGGSGEDMVCNSSDVTAAPNSLPVPEEGNVDSTSQSSLRNNVRHSLDPHPSADSNSLNSHLTEDSEASSFCDSNSERGDYAALEEGLGVSSSGPADSQSTEVLGRGHECVVSHVHSSVSPCGPSVASSPQVSDSPISGREVCTVSASSSSGGLAADNADPQTAGRPTSSASPSGSNVSLPVADSASQRQEGVHENAAVAHSVEGSDRSVVGTSSPQNSSSQSQSSMEPSTSWSRGAVSDSNDGSQPVSSQSVPQSGLGEGETCNSSQAVSISSASSEDSLGAAPSTSSSTSEAQAAPQPAPVAKRKVSLFEYRKRLKGKSGSSGGTATSPKSTTSDNGCSSRRSILDRNITLAPLPLFEPITINTERRESREKKEEKQKPMMSLSDRLRIEFGLEDCEEEERAHSGESLSHSLDVPPPPPLPPNGVVGGLGATGPRSLSATTGPRPRPTDDEADNRQPSSSGFPAAPPPPSGSVTPSSIVAAAAAVLASSLGINPAGAAQPSGALQPGFSWASKLPSSSQGLLGVSPGVAGQQPPTHSLQGPSGSHLPNGSHNQLPAAGFSSGAAYQAPPQQGHQPFRNTAKQQQQQPPPPPPPLPNTAYPPYIAQTRTHPPPPHPQTSNQASSSSSSHISTRHGRSSSFSHRSPHSMGVSPTSGRSRRPSSEDHLSPTRRHHHDYSHLPSSSEKRSKGSLSNHTSSSDRDRKRH